MLTVLVALTVVLTLGFGFLIAVSDLLADVRAESRS